jgi:excisionase family DNA binding protein
MAEVTIAQAAATLGVSDDTIRRRIKAGELDAREDERGRKLVTLPDETPPTATAADGASTTTANHVQEWLTDVRAERDRLAEQVRFLAQQLDASTTAQSQLRELLAREQSRTLALPAPHVAPQEDAVAPHHAPQEPARQRWWQRLIGR